jgi:hypothetical protein
MKYMSATTAKPMPEPALVPIPIIALAAKIPAHVGAAAEATCPAMPRIDTKMKIGRRPYTLDSGDQISGKAPEVTIATVREYDACCTVIPRALAISPYAEFYT